MSHFPQWIAPVKVVFAVYGLKGEKRHLVLKESDLRFDELMKACHSFGVEGLAICESPNLEEDAQLLQQTYRELG